MLFNLSTAALSRSSNSMLMLERSRNSDIVKKSEKSVKDLCAIHRVVLDLLFVPACLESLVGLLNVVQLVMQISRTHVPFVPYHYTLNVRLSFTIRYEVLIESIYVIWLLTHRLFLAWRIHFNVNN